ncbi:hypothetical protein F25303_11771 [Fusarium sp. NRRL 25303]|nr:hypothetical protein F25303_11771 [Fusarium sp. NRRL 25303]
MPSNRLRAQGSTKSPFERQRARDGYRRRQSRRQQAAAHESGGGHAESDSNGVQGVEGHPSDAGHVGMTGDRDEAVPQVQQTAEAAVQEASSPLSPGGYQARSGHERISNRRPRYTAGRCSH